MYTSCMHVVRGCLTFKSRGGRGGACHLCRWDKDLKLYTCNIASCVRYLLEDDIYGDICFLAFFSPFSLSLQSNECHRRRANESLDAQVVANII